MEEKYNGLFFIHIERFTGGFMLTAGIVIIIFAYIPVIVWALFTLFFMYFCFKKFKSLWSNRFAGIIGIIFGFMLPMGSVIINWAIEDFMFESNTFSACNNDEMGVQTFVDFEKWKKQIGAKKLNNIKNNQFQDIKYPDEKTNIIYQGEEYEFLDNILAKNAHAPNIENVYCHKCYLKVNAGIYVLISDEVLDGIDYKSIGKYAVYNINYKKMYYLKKIRKIYYDIVNKKALFQVTYFYIRKNNSVMLFDYTFFGRLRPLTWELLVADPENYCSYESIRNRNKKLFSDFKI